MASSSSSSSEGMCEITVKTLDGKNRTFAVPETLTIRQFKEKISSSIEIVADSQRLIFQGRVMQDEKVLKDYNVHGKVIHLVQRAPPSSLTGSSSTPTSSTRRPPPPPGPGRPHVIHLGRVQQQPSSREARARLRQAEFNLTIINDALRLLEQRTGATPENQPATAEAESRSEAEMDTSTTASPEATSAGTQSGGSTTGTTTGAGPGAGQTGTAPSASTPLSNSTNQDNSLAATDLADFLDRVLQTNSRMVPHLQRYRNYLRSEESLTRDSRDHRDAQETVNRVNEALHAMGHMMHSLSDVMIDMGAAHPRQGIAHPPSLLPLSGGTTSMSIPIHMDIRARPANLQQQRNQTQTPPTTTATGPSVSSGSSTVTSSATTVGGAPSTTTTTSGLLGATTTTFGPFQIPLGTIPLAGAGNGNNASLLVEALPPQISVASFDFGPEDDDGQNGESNDEPTVTVEGRSAPDGRPSTLTSGTAGSQPPPTSSGSSTGHMGATSSFTIGPTTSVNVTPNIPGMPPGMLQNIIGTLINQQVRGSHPIHVNVVRHTAPRMSQQQPQQQPQQQQQQQPQQQQQQHVVMDLPVDSHMEIHQRVHSELHRNAVASASGEASATSTDASQQASPSTAEVGTGTSNNASTTTSSEAATNTNTGAAPSSTAATNTDPRATGANNAPAGNNSSVGTGTDPGLGVNSRSTNTPRQIQVNMNIGQPVHGIPAGLRPPRQGQQPQQQQRAGPPPHHHHHHHHFQMAPPGTGAMLNSVYADPYLQCNSHNYDTPSARSAFVALQTNMRARGQQMPGSQQQVPNLSTMVSGMVGNIIEQVGQAFNIGGRPGTNGNNPAASSTSTTAAQSNSTRTTTAAGNTSATTSSTSSRTTATSSSSSTRSTGPTPPPPFNPMEMFAGMFGGPGARPAGSGQMPFDINAVLGNLMQAARNPGGSGGTSASQPGGPPGGTLADMFTYFRSQGQGQEEESSNVLVLLLETVAPHMGLADLFSLVMGNSRVVAQLRAPLQQFVSTSLASADGSIDTLITKALDDMMPEIEHIQGLVRVRPGVDMARSVRACLQTHLAAIFTAILSESPNDDDEFGRNLYALWMKMMAETIGLCIYCIQDGQAGFSDMVQRYMPRMTQGMNPAITIWMTTSLQDILASFHRNHPVAESQILGFVVRTDTNRSAEAIPTTSATRVEAPPPPQTRQANSSSNNTEVAAPATPQPTPMEVSAGSPSPQPPKAKAARTSPEEDDAADIFEDAQETLASRPASRAQPAMPRARPSTITASSPAVTGQRQAATRNGRGAPDNWQAVIPQEWIPVINQDVLRQQEQRPQAQLSDAYLQGLPAKRRRMMTMEHSGEMGNMGRYLPAALTRAARAAGVEPISSEENLACEAAENRELQAELEQEVVSTLGSRINSDRDFSSERFPHSKEYFHKSKRH